MADFVKFIGPARRDELKSLGLWEQFEASRDAYQLPPYSLTAREANDRAYKEAVASVTPKPDKSSHKFDPIAAAIANHIAQKPASTATQDFDWVKENWALEDMDEKSAPSISALAWAKKMRSDAIVCQQFYRDVFPRFLPTSRQLEDQTRGVDDATLPLSILKEIEQLAEKYKSNGAAETADAVA